jgi:hypothetical protein
MWGGKSAELGRQECAGWCHAPLSVDRKPLGTSTIGPRPARPAPAVVPHDPPRPADACRSAIGRRFLRFSHRASRVGSVLVLCVRGDGRHGSVLPSLPSPNFRREKVHFMRIQNSYAAATFAAAIAAVVCSAAFQPAQAGIVVTASQSGSNVVLTVSGSLNLAGLGTPSAGILDTLAVSGTAPREIPPVGTLSILGGGGSIGNSFDQYEILGDMFAGQFPFTNMSGETNASSQFGTGGFVVTAISGLGSTVLGVPAGYVSNSPIASYNLTATYNNLTLADFGWFYSNPRTLTLPNGDTIVAVPEPTHMVFVAGVGAALGAWRLRKLRRSGEVAGEAVAS